MADRPTWFPFDFPAWFLSPRVMAMSFEQRGLYHHLIGLSWLDRTKTLPADPARLAALVGYSPARWAEVSGPILECFEPAGPGRITSPKHANSLALVAALVAAQAEREALAAARSAVKSKAGRASGKVRRGERTEREQNANRTRTEREQKKSEPLEAAPVKSEPIEQNANRTRTEREQTPEALSPPRVSPSPPPSPPLPSPSLSPQTPLSLPDPSPPDPPPDPLPVPPHTRGPVVPANLPEEIAELARRFGIRLAGRGQAELTPALREAIVKACKARATHRELSTWQEILEGLVQNEFLMRTFDGFCLGWICGPKNMAKILAGNYPPTNQKKLSAAGEKTFQSGLQFLKEMKGGNDDGTA